MNTCLKLASSGHTARVGVNYVGHICGYDKQTQRWLIEDCFAATCAVSLLVKPCIGDLVGFTELDQQYYITQLLSRQDSEAELLLESRRNVHWIAPQLRFTALHKLELASLNKVVVMGKNTVISAANAMVQQAENLIQQVSQFSLNAKELLKLHGKHQVITAEKDVRIDGERINMG